MAESEIIITEKFSAKELLAMLSTGEIDSEDVVIAFSKRAAIAQQLTACLTETFFDRALERARFLDDYLKTNKKPIGPLHGLPISIKDSFNYEGIPSTLGFVSFLKHLAPTKNSALVDILLDQGAVLYVKTNVPQTLMTSDSENNVFGRTLNPLNLSLTAGGSSGGESALVAFRGSPLGVGTDLGGSIRMPALCCGTYGFKPTSGRIPYSGQTSSALGGYVPVRACAGPLSNLDDMKLFMESVIAAGPHKYDGAADATPWRSEIVMGKVTSLKIGLLAEDPGFPLHAPVQRAISEAAERLKRAGHTIINIPHNPKNSVSMANDLMFKYYRTDPTKMTLKAITDSGEPIVTSLVRMNTLGFGGSETEITLIELAAMNRQREQMIDAWRQVWVENDLDVLLAPPAQNTAVEHDTYNFIPYTTIWNLMDFPAIVLPFMKSSKVLDPEPSTPPPSARGPNYDSVLNHGAPCAVQLVTRRFQDEECLYAAKIVNEVLQN